MVTGDSLAPPLLRAAVASLIQRCSGSLFPSLLVSVLASARATVEPRPHPDQSSRDSGHQKRAQRAFVDPPAPSLHHHRPCSRAASHFFSLSSIAPPPSPSVSVWASSSTTSRRRLTSRLLLATPVRTAAQASSGSCFGPPKPLSSLLSFRRASPLSPAKQNSGGVALGY
ncbi:hypothetical protein JCGZ_17494 [Jatropha curcas]|uniref:Uncharacterized protein n=1 Tax=Jatropha curcas TaxID=180498 RepID=A0A067K2J9_JATCU|nr:hypothetical protein JCGZ_17494 [Jatropha curcas]